jgi:ketosteroid isomerase-like protein
MSAEGTRAAVERLVAARASSDAAALATCLTDDVELHFPASVGFAAIRGRAPVATALTGGSSAGLVCQETIEREIRAVIVDGVRAAVVQAVRALTVDGRPYSSDSVWICSCRAGRVARIEEFTDTLRTARIFGWVTDAR